MISFYTPNSDYSLHAARLDRECDKLRLKRVIEALPDQGDYLANCRQKPRFIRDMLKRLNKPVLWVDVDASIYRKPMELANINADFAAVPKPAHMSRAWYVCALYFSPIALPWIEGWIKHTDYDQWSDDSAFDRLWRKQPIANCLELPSTYFGIIDIEQPRKSQVIGHRISSGEQKTRFLSAQTLRAQVGGRLQAGACSETGKDGAGT